MDEMLISPSIRKIYGGIEEIVFKDQNGKPLSKIGLCSDRYKIEVGLKEGEKIIGVHGTKDQRDYFSSLGFVVWIPPMF
jgi:hypothetical protein